MNKNLKNYAYMSFAFALAMTTASCSDDNNKVEITETDAAYVGNEVGNFTAEEWQAWHDHEHWVKRIL